MTHIEIVFWGSIVTSLIVYDMLKQLQMKPLQIFSLTILYTIIYWGITYAIAYFNN